MARYSSAYGTTVTKEDIFYYVYAVLHSHEYRQKFAADLRKMIPRIPLTQDFWGFSRAGRDLAGLHLNYETVDPWPVTEERSGGSSDFRLSKMRFDRSAGAEARTSIVYNRSVVLRDIPLEAYEYEIHGKSAIEWIMDRYQVRTDKSAGISNDPNSWGLERGDPRYVLDLVRRFFILAGELLPARH